MPRKASRDDIRKAFGWTIKKLRKKTGTSQERLANDSGIDRAYMSGMERGMHTPTLQTIYNLLPYLKVSFAEFAIEFDAQVKKVRRQSKPPQPPESDGDAEEPAA